MDTIENLSRSLSQLAALGHHWLARGGAASTILAQNVGLTSDLVQAAGAAADALVDKSADASLEGRARAKDTPVVNRAEGWFLFEMMEARRLFGEANEKNKLVPKLVPGAAIRHAFGARSSGEPADEPAPAPVVAGAPATTPA